MLQPAKNRHNYSDLLTPPDGYKVDFAIGTTYSLDLEALVGVSLALGLSNNIDQSFLDNPIAALEALRQNADKFILFCEAGQIKVPQEGNNIFALLENSVFEVALNNDHSFHPKTWIIKYINDQDESIYRFIVLSRNLTFDRSWDITVAFEGKAYPEKTTKNKPLIKFLTFLIPYSTDNKKTDLLKMIISELEFIHFDPKNDHFPDYEFLPLGINGSKKEETGIFETYHDLIVISPFISTSIICDLNKQSLTDARKVLMTRKSELQQLTDKLIKDFEVYTLKDAVIEGESMISGEHEEDEVAQDQDIHAKLYARTKYNKHHFYIGSANSSFKAFNGNVEFLLKLNYKKWGFKLDDLLVNLFGEEEQENPFEKIDHLPEKDNDIEPDILHTLQKGIKSLCRTRAYAQITEASDDFTLQINFTEVPSDISLTISPLLSKAIQPLQNKILFENLRLLELGEFYKVTATKDNQSIERIIKIETKGIPYNRENEIFRKIVHDPHTFLMYVALLLADDFLLAMLENSRKKDSSFGSWSQPLGDHPVLYENLLRAASRSPEKLDEVAEIMKIINDDDIIPKEFNHLYQTFLDATKAVLK